MYIVAIAWLYVTVLMAATEETFLAGISTFFFYGLLPCSIVMYLMGAPGRRRALKAKEAEELAAAQAADSAEATSAEDPEKPSAEKSAEPSTEVTAGQRQN